MTKETRSVLTVGHSTHSIDAFLMLLRQHRVTAIADVRSAPFSRFNPQFNRDKLATALRHHGIEYVFLGRELGARSEDAACYESGRVRYDRLARTETFQRGIVRLMRGSEKYLVAIMCAEHEPLTCHRTLLVARALDEIGVGVSHILGDGRLESHRDAMERLLDLVGMPHTDMFRSHEDLVAEAILKQEEKVAYVDERLKEAASGGEQ